MTQTTTQKKIKNIYYCEAERGLHIEAEDGEYLLTCSKHNLDQYREALMANPLTILMVSSSSNLYRTFANQYTESWKKI